MGGIGTAICQRLYTDGLTVVAGCGPNSPRRERWIAEQAELGYSFIASEGNVADWEWRPRSPYGLPTPRPVSPSHHSQHIHCFHRLDCSLHAATPPYDAAPKARKQIAIDSPEATSIPERTSRAISPSSSPDATSNIFMGQFSQQCGERVCRASTNKEPTGSQKSGTRWA